jgi:hypothetical protein
MTISFSRIALKLIEVLIKTVIVLWFLATILFLTLLYIFEVPSKFDIDFMAINSCFEVGRKWNYDEGICMWVNEEKQ